MSSSPVPSCGRPLRFVVDGSPVELPAVDPSTMLLDWLRESGRTGTKEGCAEGDCGACTVVLARRDADGSVRAEPCNACIRPLSTVDGLGVLTVEGLGGAEGTHPIQQAMIEHHGSQCGFCTPGFVMAIAAACERWDGAVPEMPAIADALAGNLCRCTGYRSIVDATRDAATACARVGGARALRPAWLDALPAPSAEPLEFEAGGVRWHAPHDAAEVDRLLAAEPEAWLLAGGTDIGLWITKALRSAPVVVWVGAVEGLRAVTRDATGWSIGAAVSLADAFDALSADFPEFDGYWARFASPAVRASGTLVGNVANGSPIGDSPAVLIALGAQVVLRSVRGSRTIALEDLCLDYKVQSRARDEWIERVLVPARAPGRRVAAHKLSKRFEQDISAASLAVSFDVMPGADGAGRLAGVRVACGGLAGIVRRARAVEAVLEGAPAVPASFDAAAARLGDDFTPMSDARASAGYRLGATAGLLRRVGLETCGPDAAGMPSAPIPVRVDRAALA